MDIVKIQEEITNQLKHKEVSDALLATTFKGLQPPVMRQAILEGMLRGFSFKDFLEKNIYAIPFSGGYSLVTSIDNARKIGMKSGVVGKSAPVFEEDNEGKLISCSVTIKRKVMGDIGEFTATVYFKEYYKAGYNGKPSLWDTKPRTMISKVAEMHALRMACPEELSQSYTEEEIQIQPKERYFDLTGYEAQLRGTNNKEELKTVWSSLPAEAKRRLETLKNELKTNYESSDIRG